MAKHIRTTHAVTARTVAWWGIEGDPRCRSVDVSQFGGGHWFIVAASGELTAREGLYRHTNQPIHMVSYPNRTSVTEPFYYLNLKRWV